MVRVLIIFFFFFSSGWGKDWDSYRHELMTRRGTINEIGKRRLRKVEGLLGREQYKKAIRLLEKLVKRKSSKTYQQAVFWQQLAEAYAQDEQYSSAQRAFTKALSLEVLEYRDTLKSIFSLAQLYSIDGKYGRAKKEMEKWFAITNKKTAESFVLMSDIKYQLKDTKGSLKLLLKGIKIKKIPPVSWMARAASILYNQKRYKEASHYLYRLVERDMDKKSYWKQLAQSLIEQGQGLVALSAFKLAMMLKLLNSELEIINVANSYYFNGLPFEASELLQMAMDKKMVPENKKNLEYLVSYLSKAKEFSAVLTPLAKVAQMAKDGRPHARLARIFLERGEYKKAIQWFDRAMAKGGLKAKERGEILLNKGITLVQMGRPQKGIEVLARVEKTHKSQGPLANNWISYAKTLIL